MPIKKSLIIALGFLAFVPALYFYIQYQKVHRQLQNPNLLVSQEAKELLTRVGQLMVLPEGEEPTVATVSDKEKLKDQPFFAKAKNGDKLIIYAQARRAILYDPIADKIVDVASLSSMTATEPAATPTLASIKIALFNGTQIKGLTVKAGQYLKGKIVDFEVSARGDTKNDYVKNLVIDLSGNQEELIKQIAKIINGETGSLPEGELEPEAEVLIILGEDNFE